jgi:hypothetical protein
MTGFKAVRRRPPGKSPENLPAHPNRGKRSDPGRSIGRSRSPMPATIRPQRRPSFAATAYRSPHFMRGPDHPNLAAVPTVHPWPVIAPGERLDPVDTAAEAWGKLLRAVRRHRCSSVAHPQTSERDDPIPYDPVNPEAIRGVGPSGKASDKDHDGCSVEEGIDRGERGLRASPEASNAADPGEDPVNHLPA